MRLGDLSPSALVKMARTSGLRYRTGPFSVHLQTDIPDFLETLAASYPVAELLSDDEPSHFHVSMIRVGGLRRWYRPQVQFRVDGLQPFEPYPLDHAFPMYEWGINWCIGTTGHFNLILHSAVVEKEGRGVILPATPGSGKSTLCAGLVGRGWRLLSDEFGVIRHSDNMLLPIPRAAPLKNESIDIIRNYAPGLSLGPVFERTRKGTVAHMRPPVESLQRQDEAVKARWVIFPRFAAGESTMLQPQHRAVGLTKLVNNSFNYPVTMQAGFLSLTQLVNQVDCYDLPNGSLAESVDAIEGLLHEDQT
jgi:HprK-related kinase A